ncbi:Uncharacterized protein TPAR_03075 [Tolypocladium paradoxum]|uniref:Short-chain dehydrogenase/reductase tropE n=1 Tax=Tolypocladium paradoxum TaxID=94208 RepID=A0A2S4L2R2_9HYPO|nr:Uncharacterized protein TPAR_03075 [Tolypocladium paradoxum]
MASKETVFITGANTGIGFETVKALLQSPKAYHIFLGSRTPSKGEEAIAELRKIAPQSASTLELVQVDVTDDDSINKAAELVKSKFDKLDVLINNAAYDSSGTNTSLGASFDSRFDRDVANFRTVLNKAYDVNVSGAQVTTAVFTPLLLAAPSPRLVFLTSGMSTLAGNAKTFLPPWAPNPAGGWPKTDLVATQGYKACKAALNMIFLTWHWILKEDGVKTFCVSPGFLATNLGGRPELLKRAGAGDPAIGGELIRKVVEGERDADVGKVITSDGIQPW